MLRGDVSKLAQVVLQIVKPDVSAGSGIIRLRPVETHTFSRAINKLISLGANIGSLLQPMQNAASGILRLLRWQFEDAASFTDPHVNACGPCIPLLAAVAALRKARFLDAKTRRCNILLGRKVA